MSHLMKAGIVTLLALVFSTAAFAQEALDETLDNGAFALDYPSDWIVDAFLSEGENGAMRPVVFFYTSAAAQAAVTSGGDVVLPDDEAVAYVTSYDDGMLTAQAAMDEFVETEESAGSELGTVSEIETSGYDGYIVSIATDAGTGFAGMLGSRELRINFVMLAAEGALADYTETFEAMINSIRPSGEESRVQGSSSSSDDNSLTLEYNETAAGFIQDSDGDVWTFAGRAGDVISIFMSAVTIDSYLEVYDPSGNLIAEDDDSGGRFNALIEDLELEADGTYTIVARTYAGEGRGGYELTLSTSGAPSLDDAGPLADQSIVTFIEENLPLGETQTYLFEGSEGQVVTILLQSPALTMDPYLFLYDSDGSILAQDDDSAGNLDAIIENFTLPADDTYTIEVTTAYGDGGGEYRLTVVGVTLNTDGVERPAASGELIEIGDTITGNLPLGETVAYTFVGEAGDEVTIELESDDVSMDPYLELRTADGDLLTEDDDSGGNLNARIEDFELPEDGAYQIVVRTYAGVGGGSYTLTLR
jgi:hypothetical protein